MQRIPIDLVEDNFGEYCETVTNFAVFGNQFIQTTPNNVLGSEVTTPIGTLLSKQNLSYTKLDFLYLVLLESIFTVSEGPNLFLKNIKKGDMYRFIPEFKNNIDSLEASRTLRSQVVDKRKSFFIEVRLEDFEYCFENLNGATEYAVYGIPDKITMHIPVTGEDFVNWDLVFLEERPGSEETSDREGIPYSGGNVEGNVEGVVGGIQTFTSKRLVEAIQRTRPTSTISGLSKKSFKEYLLTSHDIAKDIFDKTINNKNLSPTEQRQALKKVIANLGSTLDESLRALVKNPSGPYRNFTEAQLKQQLLYSVDTKFKLLNLNLDIPMFEDCDKLLVDYINLYKETLDLKEDAKKTELLQNEEANIDTLSDLMFTLYPIYNKDQFYNIYGIREKDGKYIYIRENGLGLANFIDKHPGIALATGVVTVLSLYIIWKAIEADYFKDQAAVFNRKYKDKKLECDFLGPNDPKKEKCLKEAGELKNRSEYYQQRADDTKDPLSVFLQSIEDLTGHVSNVLIGASWAALAIGIAWGVKKFVIKED